MPFAFYDRLSPPRQRTYLRSDAIVALALPAGLDPRPAAEAIATGLRAEREAQVQAACQALMEDLAARFGVPRLRVRVYAVRPSGDWGELHGMYFPVEDGAPARIELWMRTAMRGRVVAPRTFVRTLVHEFCHHLDYEHFGFDETFHTEGFYKRESHLLNQIAGPPQPRGRGSVQSGAGATDTGTRGASAHSSS
jgi:hypothetical protein